MISMNQNVGDDLMYKKRCSYTMDSCKGTSVLVIKGLLVGWVNERMQIHNERRKSHIKDLHIQDMQLTHDGHDSKV